MLNVQMKPAGTMEVQQALVPLVVTLLWLTSHLAAICLQQTVPAQALVSVLQSALPTSAQMPLALAQSL